MRVAPLGAYHPNRPAVAAEEAIRSAAVTHAHPEGIAGAVLVTVAAAHAAAARLDGERPPAAVLLERLAPYLIEGATQRGMTRAVRLVGHPVEEAAYELGNGSQVTAQDTVPFALWTAATYLQDYPAAITACVQAGS